MATNKHKRGRRGTTIKRHNMVRAYFKKLGEMKNSRGTQKYTFNTKIDMLFEKFGYDHDYLEKIVCTDMESDNTLTLF